MVLKGFLTAAAVSSALMGWAAPAAGHELDCWPREVLLARLARVADKVPAYQGVTSVGTLLEILATPDGRWTLAFTRADGLSCPLSYGDGWRALTPAPAGEEG